MTLSNNRVMVFCARSLISASVVLVLAFAGPVVFARAQGEGVSQSSAPTGEQVRDDAATVIDLLKERYVLRDDRLDRTETLASAIDRDLSDLETVADLKDFIARISMRLQDESIAVSYAGETFAASTPLMDVWVEAYPDAFEVSDVRRGSSAERAGVRPGCQLIQVNEEPFGVAVDRTQDRFALPADFHARGHVARQLLSGSEGPIQQLDFDCSDGPKRVSFAGELMLEEAGAGPISYRQSGSTHILTINDSLTDPATVDAWRTQLSAIPPRSRLIVDLRDTPSGAHPVVVAEILDTLIEQTGQMVRFNGVEPSPSEPPQVDQSDPLTRYRIAVIVGRWTAGEAETIALALDGAGAESFGARMAGRNGRVARFDLPHTGLSLSFPVQAVIHLDGTYRQDFYPARAFNFADATNRRGEDGPLMAALDYLRTELAGPLTPLKPESSDVDTGKNQ